MNDLFINEYQKGFKIFNEAFKKGKYEICLEELSLIAYLSYHWNQHYIDTQLENQLLSISNKLVQIDYQNSDSKYILFYDGFGFDNRGLAIIYLRALIASGFKIVYVTNKKSKDKQIELDKVTKNINLIKEYISFDSMIVQLNELQNIVNRYKPKIGFLYTWPWDTSGIAVFNGMKGKSKRILINSTDHAFWLGINALDYCMEFRKYGAQISYYERKIPKEKLIINPFYPYINKNTEFEGFPFNRDGKKVIFSGGALYKTFDKKNTYYSMIEDILNQNEEVIFLYAGEGDKTNLEKLKLKYPDRMYYISERNDLYKLLENVDLYLNTYPLLGGLMTQYAVMAGKIPLTLHYDNIGDNILINQKECKIEYDSSSELVNDVKRLLNNEDYLNERKLLLKGSMISEEEFNEKIFDLLEGKVNKLNIDLEPLALEKTKEKYRTQFTQEIINNTIARKPYKRIARYYLKNWLEAILKKLKEK